MLLCDMHTHSQASHDSVASVFEMARACVEKGVSVLAVTDHCDIQYYNEHNVPSLIGGSVEQARRARDEFDGRVKILTGIEIGEGIWNKEFTDDILSRFDFDAVIGSVHAVRYEGYSAPYSTIDFSKMSARELDEYLSLYFDEVLDMLTNMPCDIMAHLTCPLRYINGKYSLGVDASKYEDKILKILSFIIENEIAMEINTSGLGTSYGALMPDATIIKRFKEMGGYLITLGSDAHTPERVGNGFEDVARLLSDYGFEGYYYYQGRKAIFCEI